MYLGTVMNSNASLPYKQSSSSHTLHLFQLTPIMNALKLNERQSPPLPQIELDITRKINVDMSDSFSMNFLYSLWFVHLAFALYFVLRKRKSKKDILCFVPQ